MHAASPLALNPHWQSIIAIVISETDHIFVRKEIAETVSVVLEKEILFLSCRKIKSKGRGLNCQIYFL